MKKLWAILLMLVLCAGMMMTANAADDTYTVKVNGGTGSGEYTENETVTVKANEPPAGQYFVRWETQQILNNVNLYDSEISFKSDDYYYITLTAIFAYPHEYTPCGDTSCADETHPTHTAHNYLPLEDVNDLRIDEGENYYYLVEDITLVDTPTSTGYISIGSGETLYLCLHGNDIISSVFHGPVFQLSGTGKLVLCDCTGTNVNNWGKITHATGSNGIGIKMSGSQNDANDPVFEMYGGNITGNNPDASDSFQNNGAGVYADYGAAFTMYNGAITNNKTKYNGGGVCTYTGAKFTMYGGIISGNSADDGAGVYNDSVNTGNTAVIIHGGTISNNTASSYGGGVYMFRNSYSASVVDLIIDGGSISGNKAYYKGGGVYLDYAQATMSAGTITGNETTYNTYYTPETFGGGMYIYGGKFNMNGGSITGNKAEAGAGVYVAIPSRGMTAKGNATVTGNLNDNVYLDADNYNQQYISVTGSLTGQIGVYTKKTPVKNAPVRYLKPSGHTITQSDLDHTASDRTGEYFVKNIDRENYGIFGYVQYTVTVTTDGNGTASANYTLAESGTPITLTATPTEDYTFKEWQVVKGGVTITDNKFTMGSEDVEIKAIFEEIPATIYTVNVNTQGNGIVTADPSSSTADANITLTITPADGWELALLEVGSTDVTEHVFNNQFQFTMPESDITVNATFQEIPPATYPVTVTNGTGDGNYAEGAAVTITADTPAEGKRFSSWTSADGVTFADASAATTTFTMPAKAVTVTANYEDIPPVTYTVTVTIDGNGTASANPASGVTGTEVALSAAPAEGYTFKEWQVVSGNVTIADNKFLIGTENVEVKAVFEVIPVQPDPEPETYTVTFDANGGEGSMAPQIFTEGKAQPLSANTFTREGYTFIGWNMAEDGAGAGFQDGAVITVTGDVTFYAQWRVNAVPDPNPNPKPEANPLLIIRHPVDQIAVPGETAEFTVVASGDGLTYQWYINRGDDQGWVKLQGATGPVHTTSPAEMAFDGFQYACEVRDIHGSSARSDIAVLYVAAQPVVPETGDHANLGILCAMLFISCAGCSLLAAKNRKRTA